MKKIKEILFRLFFRLGVVPYRIHSPQYFYSTIQHLPASQKEHDLKRHANIVLKANDHRYYESLLKAFGCKLDVDIEKANFVGNGVGEASLDTYRKVIIDGKIYFEKVFFTSRTELETAEWFQQHIHSRLKGHVVTASLEKLVRTDFITITYYEFLELTPFSTNENFDAFIKLTKNLYLLSDTQPSDMDDVYTPAHVRDFRFHFRYRRNAIAAERKLRLLGVDFEKLIRVVECSKKILTHGDINPGNAFKGPTLIDWDSFGIYPLGLEVANLYFRMAVWDKQCADPRKWLEDNYKTAIAPSDWVSFKRNFFFFLYVFTYHFFQRDDYYANLEQHIIRNLTQFIPASSEQTSVSK